MMEPRPTGVDVAAKFRKRTTRSLRFLLLLAVMGTAYAAAQKGYRITWQFWLAAGLLFLSNIAYHFERTEIFSRLRLSALLFIFDLSILGCMLAMLGEHSSEFFVLFALTVLMSAITRSVSGAFVSTVAVGALYTILTLLGRSGVEFLSPAFLTRISLLFVLSIFITHLAREAEQARGAARLSADLYRGLFEMHAAFLFLCDREGRILQVNRAVEQGLGYAPGELAGRPLRAIAGLPDGWPALDIRSFGAEVVSLKMPLSRKNGVRLRTRALVSVIPSPPDVFVLVLAHRKSRQLALLRRAVADAERKAAVGRLVSAVVHELNVRIGSVMGFSQLLGSRGLDADALGYAKAIEQDAAIAGAIIQNLMVFSHPERIRRIAYSLNRTVSSVLELMAYRLRTEGVELAWQPGPALPDAVGDSHQVGLVLLYLVDRIHQAIDRVGSGGSIRVRTSADGDHLCLEVSGAARPSPGRTTAEIPRPSASELGSYRSIMKGQGGRLEIENWVDAQWAFCAWLPVMPAEAAAHPAGAEPDRPHGEN